MRFEQQIASFVGRPQSPRLIGWDMDYDPEPNTPEFWLASFFSYVLESHTEAEWGAKSHSWQLPVMALAARESLLRGAKGEPCPTEPVSAFIETYLRVEEFKRFRTLTHFWYSLHWQEVSESELTPQRRADFIEIFENYVLCASDPPSWRSRRLWQESGFTYEQLFEAMVWGNDDDTNESGEADEIAEDQKGADYAETVNRA